MSHIQVYGRPLHKKWWEFWKVNIRLVEGTDYKLDGYDIKCINPKIRHNYTMVIRYAKKFRNGRSKR